MTITIDDHDIFGRSTSPLPEAPESDPLVAALLDADDTYRRAAEFEHSEKEDAARDAAIARLSAVLAAARAVVRINAEDRVEPWGAIGALTRALADADAAR
jgi:hypothetical protein